MGLAHARPNEERYVGGIVYFTVLCDHPSLVSLLFAVLVSLHPVTFFNVFDYVIFFSSRRMFELKFAITEQKSVSSVHFPRDSYAVELSGVSLTCPTPSPLLSFYTLPAGVSVTCPTPSPLLPRTKLVVGGLSRQALEL